MEEKFSFKNIVLNTEKKLSFIKESKEDLNFKLIELNELKNAYSSHFNFQKNLVFQDIKKNKTKKQLIDFLNSIFKDIKINIYNINIDLNNILYIKNYLKALNVASQDSSQQSYRESFIQWMRLCYGKDVVGMMNWSEEMASEGKISQLDFLTYALHMMRQSMLSNYTGEDLLTVSDEEYQFLTKFGKFITGKNIMDFNEKLSQAQYHIERNANPKILFTNLSFQVMKLLRQN